MKISAERLYGVLFCALAVGWAGLAILSRSTSECAQDAILAAGFGLAGVHKAARG